MKKAVVILIGGILVLDVAVLTVSFLRQAGKLQEATANVSAMTSQAGTKREEISLWQSRLSALRERLAQSEANTAILQERLTAAETNVTALRERLANITLLINPPGQVAAPAAFIVDNVTVTPGTMPSGSIVTVMVAVSNTGGQAGTYRVNLLIREYSQEIYDDKGQDITLDSGRSGNVTFRIPIFDKGRYILSVNNIFRDLVVT